jgi:hypothetical protein
LAGNSAGGYAEIVAEWRRVRSLIEPELRRAAKAASEAGLVEVSQYIVRGGKRFRGFLVILAAEALGAQASEALDAAVAIELVHSASLAIDDIIDKDEKRRGLPVAWMVHGVEKTVLASLLMIPVAQRMVERYGVKALARVIRAWERTVRGEIIDYLLAGRIGPGRYVELIDLKTGSLFALAAALGAIAAGRDDLAKPLEEYGLRLGRIYQIADDAADYYAYLTGSRRKLDPSERLFEKWAITVLGAQPGRPAVEAALAYLRGQAAEASRLLEALPEGPKKRLLQAIPPFMVEKLLEESGLALPGAPKAVRVPGGGER